MAGGWGGRFCVGAPFRPFKFALYAQVAYIFKKTLQPVLEESGGSWEPGPRAHSKHGGRRQCT